MQANKRVEVVYYLCRNGNLENPHFMEVGLSCNEGLFLRDFIRRLNTLRGPGIASLYSWSAKRSYKNGFVWQDLSENDFIYPIQPGEYILKGSALLLPSLLTRSQENLKSEQESDCTDIKECNIYIEEEKIRSSGRSVNVSTQTDDNRIRRIFRGEEHNEIVSTEIFPPPPAGYTPETLKSLMKAERLTNGLIPVEQVDGHCGGESRSSKVLTHLISCGSVDVKDQVIVSGHSHKFRNDILGHSGRWKDQ